MIGNECPECGKRINGKKCSCGWIAEAEESILPDVTLCEACGQRGVRVAPFHPNDDEGAAREDRGKRLCALCWIEALKRRAALDPISESDRQGLKASVLASLAVIESRRLVELAAVPARGAQERER